jgi:hypothetical protein
MQSSVLIAAIGGSAVGGGCPASAPPGRTVGLAAAAIRPGDDLQQVTVRIFEVQAAAAVPVVDHPGLGLARICPVRQVVAFDAAKGRIELLLPDQEGVMLRADRPVVSE